MIPGARLVMLGRQGAGKGTQCTRLSRHFVVPHISTGDMLRAAVKEGTAFGRKAQDYMSAGELLPDDIIIGIVEERLLKDDTRNRGFILDGFPRTEEQAESLAEITAHQPLDMVVDLDVPTDVVLERLASRRVCVDCGSNYSLDAPPKHNWSCDHCGGEVIQRDDDTEDAIRRRLALYEEETAPLVDWYRSRDLLMVIDGDGDADEVTGRLIRAIELARS
ncbi:MAG: adenylate kinase [Acidimicrobiales bacterium]